MLSDIFAKLNSWLLKMDWLKAIFDWVLLDLFGMNQESDAYASLSFFCYDIIKIFILLSVLIFISSYLQTFIDIETTKRTLKKIGGFWGNLLGALMGTVTPFCSCSSIPIFIGFTRAGLPVGVTFSFLISSPMVDLASVVYIASVFGWKIALIYVGIGIILAVIGGTLISALKMDRYIEKFVTEGYSDTDAFVNGMEKLSQKMRLSISWAQVKDIVRRVWKYIIIGVAIGALIHGYIPTDVVSGLLGSNHWYSVFVAVIMGIPMYADIFGTLPIAEALFLKGVSLGTILAFMMSVTTLSLPSLIMLKKVVKKELLTTFIVIVTLGIIIIGFIFNLIL